jgi:2-C-methyl-D-erythritol 2,4-cyclodiphosphate synthase
MRSGIGFDFHRLVEGRPLVLGGVPIPWRRGLLGHSDADALVHAVCDAVLGAAGLGDIGLHFPDSDPRFQGISSLRLLESCRRLAGERGLSVVNVDAVILAEAPRTAPYRLQMQANIARALGMAAERVNVKATTMEACGPVGRGEGIGAMATALLAPAGDEEAAGAPWAPSH